MLLALALVPSVASAVQGDEVVQAKVPSLNPASCGAGLTTYICYHAQTGATTVKYKHTRTQFTMHFKCSRPGDPDFSTTAGGYVDEASATKTFVSPVISVVLPVGAICDKWADWSVEGSIADCPHVATAYCDGQGTSAHESFSTELGPHVITPKGISKKVKDEAQHAADELSQEGAKFRATCKALGNARFADQGSCGLWQMATDFAAKNQHVANDPPDSRYRKRVRLRHHKAKRFKAGAVGHSAVKPLNAFSATTSDASATTAALVSCVERAQGAELAKKTKYVKRQRLAAARFARRLARLLRKLETRSKTAAAALALTRPQVGAHALDDPDLLASYEAGATALSAWAAAIKKNPLAPPA